MEPGFKGKHQFFLLQANYLSNRKLVYCACETYKGTTMN